MNIWWSVIYANWSSTWRSVITSRIYGKNNKFMKNVTFPLMEVTEPEKRKALTTEVSVYKCGFRENFYAFSVQQYMYNKILHRKIISKMYLKYLGVLVSQSYPTLCDPIDRRPLGSSVHGILQVKMLEWVATPFSKGSSQPTDRTQVSYIAGRFFTIWATWESLF